MAGLFEFPKSEGVAGKPRPFDKDVLDTLRRDDEAVDNLDRFVRARKPGETIPVTHDLKKEETPRDSGLM